MKTHIDRDLLHQYMWESTDPRTRKFSKTQTQLADELDVTNAMISHIFNEFKAAGRIKKMGSNFYVTDPEVWKWSNPAR